MSASTPLLSKPSSDPEIPANDSTPPESLDMMIDWCMGGFSWRQFFHVLFVSVAWFFDGQQACISDFTDLVPTWHCSSNSTACSSTSSLCDLSAADWSWDGPASKSIISEWALECSGSFITGLPTSCFYMGCLVGGIIFATLADSSLGRKNMLVVSCLIMSLSAFATVFSTNIWMYSALRFVSGMGRATIGTCSIVLSSELVGSTWRGLVGMIGLFVGTLGLLSLPAIAYLLQAVSWRYLYLATSLPGVIYCVIVFFFITESPKWLLMQGRLDEAMEILENMTSSTKHFRLKQYISDMSPNLSPSGMFSSLKDLFRTRWVLNRLLKVMVLGFGVGMMYYGMLLGVGNLGFDIYITVSLNALLVIPSYYVAYLSINRFKRKSLLLGFCTISGVLSIVCAFMNDHKSVKIGVELVSFFFICMAYNVLMIYTIELFPTMVRNSATSMMRQAVIVGVLFDPTLISIGRSITYLTYLVFGVVVIICGTAVIFLPETKGVTVGDHMEEQ